MLRGNSPSRAKRPVPNPMGLKKGLEATVGTENHFCIDALLSVLILLPPSAVEHLEALTPCGVKKVFSTYPKIRSGWNFQEARKYLLLPDLKKHQRQLLKTPCY